MISTILIVIAVAVAAVLAYAATKPNTFLVRRSASIAAPLEKIFPMVDDLRAQSAWSPFEKDPNMKRTHSGAPRGKGAVYEWDGNRQVGAGRIAITDSVPPAKVVLLLEMSRPFKAHNTVEFTLDRIGAGTNVTGTKVTWAMQGRQPYMAKVMGLFVDCDKMCGGLFEEGLAKLKALAEGEPTTIAAE
jgi:polyketide cyclase/dehydrase/lipid transport protein